MSEQPKRITGFLTIYDFGVGGFFEDRKRADSARGSNGRTAEITELREGESIIGPEERAVIEAAKQIIAEWDARNVSPGRTSAGRQCMESAIGRMREARRNG